MADRAVTTSQTNTIDIRPEEMSVVEKLIVNGDLSSLKPEERVTYYLAVCRAAKLNPLNRPFDYLMLDGKLTLYTNKRGADEIRSVNRVSIEIVEANREGPVYKVTAKATLTSGRSDTATGAVPIVKQEITGWEKMPSGKSRPIKGDAWVDLDPIEYSNAIMKAETKAKRRVALSIVGLGMIDETELDTIPGARKVDIDYATGEIIEASGVNVRPITSAQSPADAWERASKRLHATAADHGITHDDLHAWAVDKKFGSVKDVPTGALNAMADSIRDRPGDAKKYFDRWRSEQDETTSPEPIEAEHRPVNTGPITDDEVDAAINTATPGSLPLDMVDGGDPDRFAR